MAARIGRYTQCFSMNCCTFFAHPHPRCDVKVYQRSDGTCDVKMFHLHELHRPTTVLPVDASDWGRAIVIQEESEQHLLKSEGEDDWPIHTQELRVSMEEVDVICQRYYAPVAILILQDNTIANAAMECGSMISSLGHYL